MHLSQPTWSDASIALVPSKPPQAAPFSKWPIPHRSQAGQASASSSPHFKLHITCDGPAVNGPPCAILRRINLVATPWGDKGIDSGKVLPCSGSCSLIIMMNGLLLPCRVSYVLLQASLGGGLGCSLEQSRVGGGLCTARE